MGERVGDEQVGDEPERDRGADGHGGIGGRTGKRGAAEHRGNVLAKIPQIMAKAHFGRARDPREHLTERRHGDDPGRALAKVKQALHRPIALHGGGRRPRKESGLTSALGREERG